MKKTLLKFSVLIMAVCFFLCVFIACGGVEFKIKFIVDGSVYATVKTSGAETVKIPTNPEKEDYVFDGWFWDKDTWVKPFTANSLLDAPLSSDMNVYAKWTFTGEIIEPEPEPTPEPEPPEIAEYFNKQPDGSYYGKVYNTTNSFDFTDKIDYDGEYSVCTDKNCTIPLNDYKTNLIEGDNVFYVLYDNGQKTTATVRRRLIYTVEYNSAGGTAVSSVKVEEDKKTTAPKNPMRVGYTFSRWGYDFNTPITGNITITAIWNANTDTKYTVNYYLENLNDDNYTLDKTEEFTGTTDTVATVNKTYEHFTIVENTVSKNIAPDGTTVINVKYNLQRFAINITADNGISLNSSYSGSYKYGYPIPQITATFRNYLGHEWQGWYSDDVFMTNDYAIPAFTVDKSVNYFAKSLKSEMSNFIFTSDTNSCTITGIKNKTVTEIIVPDYVTAINQGAFSGCSSLQNITIPFVGGSRKIASDTYQYPFGYIFGTSSYAGGTGKTQYYYGSSTSSTTNTTYYIPSSLTTVTVTGGNILYGAFYNCSGLTSVKV